MYVLRMRRIKPMKRLSVAVVSCMLCVLMSAWAQADFSQNNVYRESADVRLELLFQGVAETGLSRGLHLFRRSGQCQAWYDITGVFSAPASLDIRKGDRLKLQFRCDKQRKYIPETGSRTVSWAQAQGAYVTAWLHHDDVKLGRLRTWNVENDDNRFAPPGVQARQ